MPMTDRQRAAVYSINEYDGENTRINDCGRGTEGVSEESLHGGRDRLTGYVQTPQLITQGCLHDWVLLGHRRLRRWTRSVRWE